MSLKLPLPKRNRLRWVPMVAAFLVPPSAALCAQQTVQSMGSAWVLPASTGESLLRFLQTLGAVPAYPWSARGFSTSELSHLHARIADSAPTSSPVIASAVQRYGKFQVSVVPSEIQTWFNTALPYGMNDGAVWVGRGLTASASAGIRASWGPAELTLAPTAFVTENRRFPLLPARDSTERFGYPLIYVDVPQRFGDGVYGRFDPGQSELRLTGLGVAAGISTKNQWWGPMAEFPFTLGNNAAGLPHAFFGTSAPVDVRIAKVHARVIYASIEQSSFSPTGPDSARRFGSGMVLTVQPAWIPNLELGFSRFFHMVWPDSGLSRVHFTHVFESLLKGRLGRQIAPVPDLPFTSTDNQLASAFARWVLPRSGFEIYGEFGREDHNVDTRDLLMEPDHASTYGLGVRKAWRRPGSSALLGFTAEVMNQQTPNRNRHRSQEGTFSHSFIRQGHTHRGQLLSSAFAVGSASAIHMRLDRIDRNILSAGWSRFVVRDPSVMGIRPDIQQVLSLSRRSRVGTPSARVDILTGADAIYESGTRNQFNFRATLGAARYW